MTGDSTYLFDDQEGQANSVGRPPSSRDGALDELFRHVQSYRKGRAYYELLTFVTRFKRYSPFNAMLVHIQKPGATYVLRASDWAKYGRRVVAGAQPLVMLQPMGPVLFAFDVSDTEGPPLPRDVERPFEVRSGRIGAELGHIDQNCARDGVRIRRVPLGSQQAGSMRSVEPSEAHVAMPLLFREKHVPLRYEVVLDANLSPEAQFATLAHEFGHLYCGHLGTPNPSWWPDRLGLPHDVVEFEAESVSYLVCGRFGVETTSAEYLSEYCGQDGEIPTISTDRVMAVAGLIERMAVERMSARK